MEGDLEPFHPDWLKHEEATGGRVTIPAVPVAESRAMFDAIVDAIAPFLPAHTEAVTTQDLTLPAPHEHVKLRVYIPQTAKTPGNDPLPVGLWIHAGGWFAGSINHEDWNCRYVAERASIILFSPEYRLAPEHPFPAGFDDCCAAYEYMYHHAAEFGGDPTRKSTMGGSAAGNLSAALAVKYADHPDLKVSGCVCAAAATCDLRALPETYKKRYTPEKYRDAPMIGNEIVALAREWYGASPEDPLFSPLLHPNIGLIKKIYVTTGTKDPTHQETQFFAEECQKRGVPTRYQEYPGWPHYFWILPNLPKSYEFLDAWVEQLRWFAEKN